MATCLGDLFPDQFKNDYLGRALSPKTIVVIEVESFKLDYDKFMVLITSSITGEFMGCVSINTNPSPKNYHVKILVAEHEFLDYDSHINCTSIVPIDLDWLKNLLQEEPARIKGEISTDQHIEIINKLRNSTNITKKLKNDYNL